MATTTAGVSLLVCVVSLVVSATVFAQARDLEPEPFRDCCLDDSDPDYDIDTGIAAEAEPLKVVVRKRLPLSVGCPVVADKDEEEFGNLTYRWTKDGKLIRSRSPRSRVHVYANGTLHFKKVVNRVKENRLISDRGLYECYVANNFGTVLARRVNIIVASVGKAFTEEPEDQTVPAGGTAYFRCRIPAVPDDLLTVWHKDNSILHTDSNSKYDTEGGQLQIRNVEASDAGRYQCQVTNKAFFDFVGDENHVAPQWKISQEGQLTVSKWTGSGQPRFALELQNVTEVLVTDSAVLQCIITGVSPSPTVVWMKASATEHDVWDVVLQSSNVVILPSGTLRIHRVSVGDAGLYACSDSEGKIRSTGELRVLEPPVIQGSFQSRRYYLANIIRLDCFVSGYPLPEVRWFRNGKDIKAMKYRREFFADSLMLYHTTVDDSGYYQCLAENGAGWVLSLARIVVQPRKDAPPPPYNVTAEPLTSSSINVTWQVEPPPEPVPALSLLAFTVHTHRTDGVGGEHTQVVVSKHYSTVLVGLAPDQEYSVIVKAYTSKGASLNSKAVLVHTFMMGFPQPTLTPVGDTAIALNWSDFHSRQSRRQNIASYLIFYKASDAEHAQRKKVDGTQHSYVLRGLKPMQEYKIRMMASYKGANPDFHEDSWLWRSIRTGSEWERVANSSSSSAAGFTTPPPPQGSLSRLATPFNLHAYPLRSDVISLQWDYPKKGGSDRLPLTHFLVQCQQIDALDPASCHQHKTISFKVSHSNSAIIKELRPYTLYNISVSAHSGEVRGPYSRPIYVQTKEDVPSQPENLQAKVLAEGAVRLQWQPPVTPNGLIKGHFILYNNHHQYPRPVNVSGGGGDSHFLYDSWTEVYQKGNSTWAVVANLTQHMYFFQVKACTAAGSGAPSSLIVVHMEKPQTAGFLSDQHLGILGGSAIGLTSIIITVVVIMVKHRQLRRHLAREAALEHGRQPEWSSEVGTPGSPATGCVGSEQTEELEKLLPMARAAAAGAGAVNSDSSSNDSGCSSLVPLAGEHGPHGKHEEGCGQEADSARDDGLAVDEGMAVLQPRGAEAGGESSPGSPSAELPDSLQRETVC